MTKELYEHLRIVEGTKLHRNDRESDITTMCGIYRTEHPNAVIFTVIDTFAKMADVYSPSSHWSDEEIERVDATLKANVTEEELFSIISDFYDDYTKGAHIDSMPVQASVAMFSMYTNSPKYSSMSAQGAYNMFVKNGFINGPILKVDGALGNYSVNAFRTVTQAATANPALGYLFESYLLLSMSKYYAKLIKNNPDKYLINANGWSNRLIALAETN